MTYLNDCIQELDLAAALPQLSEQRREQALKFKHELGQRTCAAAYLLLCRALREEYGIEELPVFGYGEHGKPFLIEHPEIHFNLSHCREAVLCCVDNRPVGVDVESVRPLEESLVNYTMNEREAAQIHEAANPALEFTKLWTRKEAVQKLTGQGIGTRMQHVLEREDVVWETKVADDGRYAYSICRFSPNRSLEFGI